MTNAFERLDQDKALIRATDMWESFLRTQHALVAKRRALGLSQEDVAKALDMKVKNVVKLERYGANPRISLLIRYALLLGEKDNSQVSFSVQDDNPV